MLGAEGNDSPDALLAGVLRAGADKSAQVAVLWTWLERHLNVLGSFDETDTLICQRAAEDLEAFEGPTSDDLQLIEREPAYGAAALLARIAARQMPLGGDPMMVPRLGVTGQEVLVCWRNRFLPGEMTGTEPSDMPPAAKQAPSLAAIAPGVHVCARRAGTIAFDMKIPEGSGWDIAEHRLRNALQERALIVHLDPLVNAAAPREEDPDATLSPPLLAGSTGWRYKDGHALLLDATIRADDHERCVAAACEAVRQASGKHTLLVLPELVATSAVVEALASEIKTQDDPPILTVVGLRHRPGQALGLDPSIVGGTAIAEHVNEAIVLGPDGEELWRHRKLTRARAEVDEAGTVQERISVGDTITLVETPVGTAAVSICLDVFTDHVRERLASSAIELLLVPSLSPHVYRHQTALAQIAQGTGGLTFVCNRGFEPDTKRPTGWREPDNQSFWVRPVLGAIRPPLPVAKAHRSFIVTLPPERSGQ